MLIKLISLLTIILIGPARELDAQQSVRTHRLGYISGTGTASNQGPYVEALRQGLRDLGYIEGKNIIIEFRGAEGHMDRVPNLAAELVQLNVDVLVLPILPAILAAKKATRTIPIVMIANADPVAAGFVESLARPGGNITGFATLSADLSGKRLEMLTETIPRLSRVGVLHDGDSQNTGIAYKEYDAAA